MKYECKKCYNSDNIIDTGDEYIFENENFEVLSMLGMDIGVVCTHCNDSISVSEFFEVTGLPQE